LTTTPTTLAVVPALALPTPSQAAQQLKVIGIEVLVQIKLTVIYQVISGIQR
jgi:hypothetical protein